MTDRFSSGNGHRYPALPVDASFRVEYVQRLRFTRGALHPGNPVLSQVLDGAGGPGSMAAFVDSGVAAAWPGLPEKLEAYLAASGAVSLAAPVQVVPGGEAAKNDPAILESVTRVIHDAGICRHSFVMVLGGGAVLDVVGFAAATAHRGVRLLRLPTTTLGQADAGVGVKNGVNAFGKKNFLGCFAVPWAVVNDEAFLATLPDRDWRCGLSEAVKVALLKDEPFFALIEDRAARLRDRDQAAAGPIIRRSAELHLQHIVTSGDPFELGGARPLDFGHWSAHKLEQLTGFEVRHGEAVACGVALDVLYSAMAGILAASEAERIIRLLERLGFQLYHPALADPSLAAGLEEFREHLGGRLTITLLEGIGRPVDVHEIDESRMARAVRQLAGMAAGRPG